MPNRSIQKPQATCGTGNIGTREKDARTTERKQDRIKALPRAVFLSWLAFIGKHGMLHALMNRFTWAATECGPLERVNIELVFEAES